MLPCDMRKIFYCDDDEDDLIMFRDIIHNIDPQLACETIDDSESALDILKMSAELPDVIFLDINMPRVSGIELLQNLKSHALLQYIPVCMYSTTRELTEANRCKELGAIDLLQKLPGMEESVAQLKAVLVALTMVKTS